SHCSSLAPPRHSSFLLNATLTTDIYTLSLHDALPIWAARMLGRIPPEIGAQSKDSAALLALFKKPAEAGDPPALNILGFGGFLRSEEHTSELQSRENLVCRLLLEKKKKNKQPE